MTRFGSVLQGWFLRLVRRQLLDWLEGRVLTLPSHTVREIASRFRVSESSVRSVELSVRQALLSRLQDLLGADVSAKSSSGGGEGGDAR